MEERELHFGGGWGLAKPRNVIDKPNVAWKVDTRILGGEEWEGGLVLLPCIYLFIYFKLLNRFAIIHASH